MRSISGVLLSILSLCVSAIAVRQNQNVAPSQKINKTEIGRGAKIEKNKSGTFALTQKIKNGR